MYRGGRFSSPKLLGPVLRYLIGGAALLLVGIAAAFFVVLQPLLDRERLAARVDAALLAWTGEGFAATDGVDLQFLPQPVLTVHRPRLGGGEAGFNLAADRLDLDLELWPLLLGTLVVDTANVVRPAWRLEGDPATLVAAVADRLAARGSALPIRRLVLTDGTLATAAGDLVLRDVEGVVERAAGGSRFSGSAGPAAGGPGRLGLEGQLAAVGAGRAVPLQLQLEAGLDQAVHRLSLRGELRPQADGPGLAGRLTLDLAPEADRLVAALADIWPALAVLPLPAVPSQVAGLLDLALGEDGITLGLDDVALRLGDQTLGGSLLLQLGAVPVLDLGLEADRLDLAGGGLDLGSLGRALPATLTGRMALRAGRVTWRDRAFRQVALDLGLDGQGMVEVVRATAVLPGPGDLAFSGRFGPVGGPVRPGLTGRLEAAVQAPAELVAAFAEPPLLVQRSSTLTLAADLDWQATAITLQNAELGLDALQAVGGLAYRPAAGDRLAQLAVHAVVDRLALDDVVDAAAPEPALDALFDLAITTDLAVDLRVSRTSFGALRFGGLTARLDSSNGAVAIERLGLDDIAGSAASVSGPVHAASRTFAFDLAVDVASLPRLLRLVGREPPLALALLGPLNLRGELAGDLDRAEATLGLEADLFAARGVASLTEWRNAPTGALALTVETSETATLLRRLRGITVTDPLLEGPLRAELEVEVEAGLPGATIATVTLGELVVALVAQRGGGGSGPLDRFDLELGPVSSDTANLLYQLLTPPLDLVPGPPARWPGYWPAQELSWGWLAVPAADVGVTLVGTDPAVPPIEVRAQLRDGRLTVPAFRWASAHGLVDAGMAMVGRADGRGVDLTLDLALERFVASRLLGFWGLPPDALGGTVDLEAQLATHGGSLRALVGNLRGTLDLVSSDGVLGSASTADGGIPVDRLAAALEVERGMVDFHEPGIAFSGPDGVGQIRGAADLLAWMIDLELELDGHDGTPLVRQKLFGPLPAPLVLASPPRQVEGGVPALVD